MQGNRIILLVLLLFFTALTQGQTEESKMPLTHILTELETHFSCQFNYTSKTTEKITITPPNKAWSLTKSIHYLEEKTDLNFTILANNFITIEPRLGSIICGYLKDAQTEEPITSATITSHSFSTISDTDGYFEIELDSAISQIEIRHLVYESVRFELNIFSKNKCAPIYLSPKVEALSEFIVTDYLTKGINKRSDGSFDLNFADFGILPGLIETDVLQTVQSLPGIQSINETVSDINIRGGTNDQNLLLWDGIKMYQSGHFFGLISMFNPMITPKAKLIKNGSDVDYTDGVSGTIEMATDASVAKQITGSIGLDMMSANAFVDIPISNTSSIQVAGRNGLGNFVQTPTYRAYFDRILQDTEIESDVSTKPDEIEFDFNDANLRWLWKIDKNNTLRINFLTARNEMDLNENKALNTTEHVRSGSLIQSSSAGGLYYERKWNSQFHTQAQVYGTDYILKAKNIDILKSQQFSQKNEVFEMGAKLNGEYSFSNQLSLLAGYQFTETQINNYDEVDDPYFRLEVTEFIRAHGLYSQFNYTSKNLNSNIKAGLRANYLEKFDAYLLEPRFNFNQKFSNHITFEILGEFKHQVTSQIINFQNDFLGIEKRRWQLANNTDIPIIQSKKAAIGLHWNKNGWLISGETFFKRVTGITSQSQGFQNQFEFTKAIGDYEAYGLDVLVRKKWDKYTTWLSYSNIENHYFFDSLVAGEFPNNLEIYNAITFGSTYTLGKLKLSAGFNWHSGKPTTRPVIGQEVVNGVINYDEANQSRLADYLRVDLSSTYDFTLSKNTKAYLGFSIWNLFNKENVISNYYLLDTNGQAQEKINYALRITPNFNFRVSF